MSKLLLILNKIKAQANREFLTNTQLKALVEIENLWRFPERINLWGPEGCGKTMIGWIVSKENNGIFFSNQEKFFDLEYCTNTHVIVDNVNLYEKNFRRVIAELQIRNNKHTLIITKKPNNYGFPCVYLPEPSNDDIVVVYNNLRLLGFYSASSISERNLWRVVHSVL
jgi:hypothetical protein